MKWIITFPEDKLKRIPTLTKKEHQKLFLIGNKTEKIYPNKTIHGLFEQQVEQHPNATALIYGNKNLSIKN